MPDRGAKPSPPFGRPRRSDRIGASDVAAYLRRNPEFLCEHPEILDDLRAPGRDGGSGVVDFQQAMVDRLRDRVEEATAARDALVITGRNNLTAQNRIHKAVIAFMGARNFEQLIERATIDLAVVLDLDVVTLGVERADLTLPRPRLGGICQLEPDTVDSVIGHNRNVRLRSQIQGDPMIFGAGAGLVASDALIRLSIGHQSPSALLALGSRDPDCFHPGQGTQLLQFLGEALEASIRGWLNLPA